MLPSPRAANHSGLTCHLRSWWGAFLADTLGHPEAAAPLPSPHKALLLNLCLPGCLYLGKAHVNKSLEPGLCPWHRGALSRDFGMLLGLVESCRTWGISWGTGLGASVFQAALSGLASQACCPLPDPGRG